MTEQEKFEAWYVKQYGCYPSKNNDARDHDLLDCWQAAIASRADLEKDNRLLRDQNDMLDKELAHLESREPLYSAVNAMMAHLGAHGEIDTRNPLVTAAMDALHDVDGGVYQPAKDIDMEALKRGQENASKAWAGVDVEKFLQREPQPMPLEKAEELAHRTASRYTHKSERGFTAYTFLPHTLEDFVRKIERFHGIGE